MTYRRRSSPLHAARAGAGTAYCAALALAALLTRHPAVLLALLLALAGAARGARVGPELGRASRVGLVLALGFAALNPLVSHAGETILVDGWGVPVLGELDITLEATVYGLVSGLQLLVVLLAFALYALAVDPDELLRALRRVGLRSALTATLTTRMVGVLGRDAARRSEARRCRPDGPGSRAGLVRAVTAGALDRALDVAATLEVRGYGVARRGPHRPAPWGRHDLAFAAAAGTLVVGSAGARGLGLVGLQAYPALRVAALGPALAVGVALLVVALAPFADSRGVAR